ncbi:MAG: 4-hydroxy-tetrahydrodipicolinate synthase [Porticoccaceae bacterium]
MIIGSIVALVTPMLPGTEAIDYPALRRLVDWHRAAGTAAIVAVGTTGESPTLSVEEHLRVVEVCVEQAAGRLPIIAGTGANSTAEAIELTAGARERGADACLLVTPYYNKPTQEGLYRHHRAIAEAVDIAQVLYNVPGRTGCDMLADTVVRLAQVPNIVGIKEATGDLERARDLIARCPEDFAVYSGDDATAMDLMLLGGKGNIGVTANVAPEQMRDLCDAALAGDREGAAAINARLVPLHRALFVESNPIPVKWAVAQLGLMADVLRLPLTPLSSDLHARVREAMHGAGLL